MLSLFPKEEFFLRSFEQTDFHVLPPINGTNLSQRHLWLFELAGLIRSAFQWSIMAALLDFPFNMGNLKTDLF